MCLIKLLLIHKFINRQSGDLQCFNHVTNVNFNFTFKIIKFEKCKLLLNEF